MFDNNLALVQSFNKINPYSEIDTANGMPINSPRKVEPVNYGSSIPKRMYLHSDSFICNELKINLRTESPKEFKKILKNDD